MVHQRANLLGFLSGQGNVVLACHLKNVRFDKHRYEKLLHSMDLAGHDDKPICQLSFGMCQRFGLIQALMSKSAIILLDEPTGSVDKKSAMIIKKTISQYQKHSLFVIATHDPSLVESDMVIDFDKLHQVYDFNQDRYALVKKNPHHQVRPNFYGWRQFGKDWRKAALIIISQTTIATALVVMLILFYQSVTYYMTSQKNNPYNQIVTIETTGDPIDEAVMNQLESDYDLEGYNPRYDLNSLILKNGTSYLDVQSFQLNPHLESSQIVSGRLIGRPGEILINQALFDQGVRLGTTLQSAISPVELDVVGLVGDEFNQLPSVYYQGDFLPVNLEGNSQSVNLIVPDYSQVAAVVAQLSVDYYAYSDYLNYQESYSTILLLAGGTGAFFIVVALTIGVILFSLVQGALFYERHQDNSLLLLWGLRKYQLFGNMVKESLAISLAISLAGSLLGLAAVNLVKSLPFIPEFLSNPIHLGFLEFGLLGATMMVIYGLVGLLGAISQIALIRRLKLAQVLKEE